MSEFIQNHPDEHEDALRWAWMLESERNQRAVGNLLLLLARGKGTKKDFVEWIDRMRVPS